MRCGSCLVSLFLLVACGGTAAKRADDHEEQPVTVREPSVAGNDESGGTRRDNPAATDATTSPEETPSDSFGEFSGSGDPTVVEAFLTPDASWRFLESQITALRAEASALQRDILVEFREKFFQATVRGGKRTIWRLPKGLRLAPAGRRILLRGDHTCEVFGPNGRKIPTTGEISLVEGTLEGAPSDSGSVRKIRLMVKGGREFRSINDAG